MTTYLLLRDNKPSGPYTFDELKEKGLKAYDLVWLEGKSAAWRYPCEVEELSAFAPMVEEQPFDRFFKKPSQNISSVTPAIGRTSSDTVVAASVISGDTSSVPGKRIIYVDLARNSVNATSAEYAEAAKPGRILLATHLFGIPTDIEAICELAKDRYCVVIEDVAAAFGGRRNGRFLGTFADFGIFSFQRSKRLPAFGGAIIVNNDQVACPQMPHQFVKSRVLDSFGFPIQNEQASLIAPRQRLLRNQLLRQVVIKFRKSHLKKSRSGDGGTIRLTYECGDNGAGLDH